MRPGSRARRRGAQPASQGPDDAITREQARKELLEMIDENTVQNILFWNHPGGLYGLQADGVPLEKVPLPPMWRSDIIGTNVDPDAPRPGPGWAGKEHLKPPGLDDEPE